MLQKNKFHLVIIAMLFFSSALFACDCKPMMTIQNAYENANVVFEGEILSVEKVVVNRKLEIVAYRKSVSQNGRRIMKYDVLLHEVFKGQIKSDTITLYSGLIGGDCGFKFETNKKYLIYSSNGKYGKTTFTNDKETFWTSICSRTKLTETDEVENLRKLKSNNSQFQKDIICTTHSINSDKLFSGWQTIVKDSLRPTSLYFDYNSDGETDLAGFMTGLQSGLLIYANVLSENKEIEEVYQMKFDEKWYSNEIFQAVMSEILAGTSIHDVISNENVTLTNNSILINFKNGSEYVLTFYEKGFRMFNTNE